jgi:hypothetical protein
VSQDSYLHKVHHVVVDACEQVVDCADVAEHVVVVVLGVLRAWLQAQDLPAGVCLGHERDPRHVHLIDMGDLFFIVNMQYKHYVHTCAFDWSSVWAIRLPVQAVTRHTGQGRGDCETTALPQETNCLLRRLLAALTPSPLQRKVPDMSFLFKAGVFVKEKRIDPHARLKGKARSRTMSSGVL